MNWIGIVNAVVNFYIILIIIYVLMTWFPHDKGILRDIFNVLGSVCDPYLALFRKLIPPIGNVDWSPIIAIIVLQLALTLFLRLV